MGAEATWCETGPFLGFFSAKKVLFCSAIECPPPGLEHVQIRDPKNHLFFCKPHGPWPDHCAQKTQGLMQIAINDLTGMTQTLDESSTSSILVGASQAFHF